MRYPQLAVLVGVPLLLLSSSFIFVAHAALNDCNAKVRFVSANKKGALVELQFEVTTSCPASSGRFAYSYELASRPGKRVERSANGWRGTEGQNFVLTDKMSGLSAEMPIKVQLLSDTIESTRL